MRFKSVFVLVLLCGLWPAKASADNRFIVRTTLDLETLQTVCNLPLLPCTVVRGLGDPGDELFLITSPLTWTNCWLSLWELWMPKRISCSAYFRSGH